MIESTLKKFGLNEKQIGVYLAILKLGSAPVRVIADTAQLNRTTTHDLLNDLIQEGLVSYVDKQKHRYFTAESPEHLLTRLETKKRGLEQTKRDLQEILPELKSLYEKSPTRPKAKYFESEAGLRSILQDVLKSVGRQNGEKKYYVFSSSAIRDAIHKAFPEYNEERLRAGIKVQTISIGEGGELHGLDERKWLSREQGSPTYTLIYAGKVAHISLDDKKKPLGVVLEDQNTYKTQVIIFEKLWSIIN